MPPFKLDSVYSPTPTSRRRSTASRGGRRAARAGDAARRHGTGKTMTMAATIERLQRPR
jgi:excinuclease ABC subunit B